jgi:hypothetical protein
MLSSQRPRCMPSGRHITSDQGLLPKSYAVGIETGAPLRACGKRVRPPPTDHTTARPKYVASINAVAEKGYEGIALTSGPNAVDSWAARIEGASA